MLRKQRPLQRERSTLPPSLFSCLLRREVLLGLTVLVAFAGSARAQFYGQAQSSVPNLGSPIWTQIEQAGEPVDYYRYKDAPIDCNATDPPGSCEMPASTSGPRPEINFFWQAGPTPYRTVCRIVNDPSESIYWPAAAGSFPYPPPTDFTVSQRAPNPVKGFTVHGNAYGDASGSPDGATPGAVMYFTNKPCSDGNLEYGFAKSMKTQEVLFYYSTKTNCYGISGDQDGGCRSGPSLGDPDQNQFDGPNPLHITNLQPSSQQPSLYYFAAYFVPDDNPAKTPQPNSSCSTAYKFRVQVVDGYDTTKLAQCSINGSFGWCGYDLEIQPVVKGNDRAITERFPDCTIQQGPAYLVTGVSRNNPPPEPAWAPIPTYFNVKGAFFGY